MADGLHQDAVPTIDFVAPAACQRNDHAKPAFAATPGYELLEEVGAGGMGVVYRAREIAFDRDVAVKFLQERFTVDSSAARRFLDEARITGQLQHPAIPPVHHIGTLPSGRPFLAMKLIRGETLANLLAKTPADVARGAMNFIQVFAQVCQGVAYAHSRQVIHRDLKPANIMVGAFGEVQVMDRGLAKELGKPAPSDPTSAALLSHPPGIADADATTALRSIDDSTDDRTRAGQSMGTPAYMPPEQARGDLDLVDCRADVFALGGVLCTILTGKPPYTGRNAADVMRKAWAAELDEAMSRLDSCRADADLVALCKRCLAAECVARPKDAGEVAEAVTAHLAAAEERARQAELDRVRAEEQRKRRRVQMTLAGAVIGLLVTVSFGIALAKLWRNAEGAKVTAERAQDEAENARRAEFQARTIAERAKGEAETARAAEKSLREKIEAIEHGRAMQVVHEEWRANNIAMALKLLESTKPEFRGWEWQYLHRLCHSNLITLKGHEGSVNFATISADGSRIVTVGGGMAKIWDATTATELRTLGGGTRIVNGKTYNHAIFRQASLNADASRAVTTEQSGFVRVWDVKTGVELFSVKYRQNQNRGTASFSKDGSRFVTTSARYTQVWDAATGAELLTLPIHASNASYSAFSPDGSRIVTALNDRLPKVWDAQTGEVVLTLKGHTDAVTFATFDADGSRIVTTSGIPYGSTDPTARVWDAKTGAMLLVLKGHSAGVTTAFFSKDGMRIVTASNDNTVRVWDANSGIELLTLKGHTDVVHSAQFTPDGSRIVTASQDGTARIWDASQVMEVRSYATPSGLQLIRPSFNADHSLGVGGFEGVVWDVVTGTKVTTLQRRHSRIVLSTTFSPDGTRIATASLDGTAKVWDARTGAELLTLTGHSNQLVRASFSADGSRIVTACTPASGVRDLTARVWDARTGVELHKLQGHTDGVVAAAFSFGGTRIVTGSKDKTARVWDANSGDELFRLQGHAAEVYYAAFSPDDKLIITTSLDMTAKVWDAKTGAEKLTLSGHSGQVIFASFSPGGTRIVTASGDNTVRVWDAESGVAVLTLRGHTGRVMYAAFSADGSRIVTAGDGRTDRTVKIWDARPVSREFLTTKPSLPLETQ